MSSQSINVQGQSIAHGGFVFDQFAQQVSELERSITVRVITGREPVYNTREEAAPAHAELARTRAERLKALLQNKFFQAYAEVGQAVLAEAQRDADPDARYKLLGARADDLLLRGGPTYGPAAALLGDVFATASAQVSLLGIASIDQARARIEAERVAALAADADAIMSRGGSLRSYLERLDETEFEQYRAYARVVLGLRSFASNH